MKVGISTATNTSTLSLCMCVVCLSFCSAGVSAFHCFTTSKKIVCIASFGGTQSVTNQHSKVKNSNETRLYLMWQITYAPNRSLESKVLKLNIEERAKAVSKHTTTDNNNNNNKWAMFWHFNELIRERQRERKRRAHAHTMSHWFHCSIRFCLSFFEFFSVTFSGNF